MTREDRDAEHRQLHPAEGEVGDAVAGVPATGDPGQLADTVRYRTELDGDAVAALAALVELAEQNAETLSLRDDDLDIAVAERDAAVAKLAEVTAAYEAAVTDAARAAKLEEALRLVPRSCLNGSQTDRVRGLCPCYRCRARTALQEVAP